MHTHKLTSRITMEEIQKTAAWASLKPYEQERCLRRYQARDRAERRQTRESRAREQIDALLAATPVPGEREVPYAEINPEQWAKNEAEHACMSAPSAPRAGIYLESPYPEGKAPALNTDNSLLCESLETTSYLYLRDWAGDGPWTFVPGGPGYRRWVSSHPTNEQDRRQALLREW